MTGNITTADSIRPVVIPRHCWTTDRCGRLAVGAASGVCLALGWLWPDCQAVVWAVIAGMAVQLVVTSLVGWCPFHEAIKRLGIPDREEVYARLQRTASPGP